MIKKWLKDVWSWLIGQSPTAPTYRTVEVDDVPDRVDPGTVVLVGDHGKAWLAVMKCPCACGETIQLPLTSTSGARWAISGRSTEPTLKPSVWRTSGCRSHFILSRGSVIWCPP